MHQGHIKYPKGPTEFEVQAYLYSSLKEVGVNVRGELSKKGIGRFDLVIFDEHNNALRIIEVKSEFEKMWGWRKKRKHRDRSLAKQVSKYAKVGLPVDTVRSMEEAKAYVSGVWELLKRSKTYEESHKDLIRVLGRIFNKIGV